MGRGTWVEGRLVPISTWRNLEFGTWDLELGIWVEGRGTDGANINLEELGSWILELGTWSLELGIWDFVAENSMRLSFLPRQLKYTMLYTLYNTSAIHGAGIGDYLYA